MVILNTKKHSIDFIYSLVAIDLKGYFGVSLPNVTVEELEVTASLLLRVIIIGRPQSFEYLQIAVILRSPYADQHCFLLD
jgi:hypothetical protein